MDLSGNRELLDSVLVAFFASRNSPPEAIELARRWAREIAKTKSVVISGFHSPVERAVLDILLAEGRSLYRKVPKHLLSAYDDNRALFVSFRNNSRPSFSNSQLRNWLTADLANEVVFAPFDRYSQLSTLYHTFAMGDKPCYLLE